MIEKNNYNYVWGIFHFSSTPPNSEILLKTNNGEHHFYPFEHNGDIFTIDTDLWDSKILLEESFYPELDVIDIKIKKDTTIKSKINTLIAFYSHSTVPTIDANDNITINKLPEYLHKPLNSNYECIGFDLVDVTGLSGLANIGYNLSQLIHIQSLHLKMTKWGLLSDEKQAVLLAQIVSIISPEHAPFLPMEIWMNKILK